MKKLWVVGIVVGLLLVIVAPVMAAIIFEWHDGDPCIWSDTYNYSLVCESGGFSIPSYSENNAYVQASEWDNFTSNGNDYLTISHDCGANLTAIVYDSEEDEELFNSELLSDTPLFIESSFNTGTFVFYFRNDGESSCMVSDTRTDDEYPELTETPTLLDGFTTTSIFSTASDLVAALGTVIAVIGGILLGWKVLGWLIRRFTA